NLTASVTVFNPPSPAPAGCTTACTGGGGGGSSAPATFYICPSSGCPPGTPASVSAAALVAEETPALSLDGRYVAYTAIQNDHAQVFLRDTCEGAATACQSHTTLLSTAADGTAANDDSRTPSMSADGRYVAFSSAATNLVENAPPGRQIYLLDTCAGAGETCNTDLICRNSVSVKPHLNIRPLLQVYRIYEAYLSFVERQNHGACSHAFPKKAHALQQVSIRHARACENHFFAWRQIFCVVNA